MATRFTLPSEGAVNVDYTFFNDKECSTFVFHITNLSAATSIEFYVSYDDQTSFKLTEVWDLINNSASTSVTLLAVPGLYSMTVQGAKQIRFRKLAATDTSCDVFGRFHNENFSHFAYTQS